MTKQITEEKFKEDVEKLDGFFVEKLQVNPFAFTDVSADYLIQNEKFDILCEVKEIKMRNRKTEPKFTISRLTQEKKLWDWEHRFQRNKSFIFFCFWDTNKKKSNSYLVSILAWIRLRRIWIKSDITPEEFEQEFYLYKVKLNNNVWQLDFN